MAAQSPQRTIEQPIPLHGREKKSQKNRKNLYVSESTDEKRRKKTRARRVFLSRGVGRLLDSRGQADGGGEHVEGLIVLDQVDLVAGAEAQLTE